MGTPPSASHPPSPPVTIPGPPANLVYLAEIRGAEAGALNDAAIVERCTSGLIDLAGLNPVGAIEHRFEPQGVSRAVLLAESHLAIHTWPESGTAYVTLTTCRAPSPGFEDRAAEALRAAFGGEIELRRLT